MKKLNGIKIAILVADGFEQVELTKPRDALNKEGAKTFIISPKSRVQGWNHMEKGDSFKVDTLLEEADPGFYDALILPGGVMNPDTLRTLPKAIEFIKTINKEEKPVAAICHGPWLLINAEMAKNRSVTSWPSVKTDLINAGAKWEDNSVVIDGNLITSRNPDDIPEFNKAIIELLTTTYTSK